MKIVVLGAGAMGSLYGGILSQRNEVWLIDVWKEHVQTIQQKGLTLKVKETERVYYPKATFNAAEAGAADLVLVFVKSFNTTEALVSNKVVFNEHTMILTLQNGYGHVEDILAFVKPERLLIGVTAAGATMLGPGHVFQAGIGLTEIGVYKGGNLTQALPIIEEFNACGFETQASENVLYSIWKKLLVNAGLNCVLALLGQKNAFIADSKSAFEVGSMIVAEGVQVARAEGFDFDLEALTRKYYMEGAKQIVGDNLCSMLQDVNKKRKTEVERINGAISYLGEKHGIFTPYNDIMVKLVNAKEDSYNYK